MSERKHIKVKSIGETKSVGKTTVTTFQGEDGIAYEFWGDTFKQYIVVGAEIEADIDFSEKKSTDGSTTWKHWKVIEVYLAGKPVRGEQKSQGWQPRGDNPEQRASIEKQVCLKCACGLATDKMTLKEILSTATQMYKWLANPLLSPPNIAQADKDIKELWPGGKPALSPDNAQSKSSPIGKESSPIIPEVKQPEEQKLDFDPGELTTLLSDVKFKDITAKTYLRNQFKVNTEGTIVEVVARLTKEQREAFFKELTDRKQMA